jgi:hypothetical protein
MFIIALVISVIIGYILKGKIQNLINVEVNHLYLVFTAFFIEAVVIFSIRKGLFQRGTVSFLLDLCMYMLIFAFGYFNRKNPYIVIMCFGFLLNAIPIFLNGGAMPVGAKTIETVGLTQNVNKEGLYRLVDNNTKLWFLGDVIPFKFITKLAVSIGDIVAAVGLMLFVIMGMRKAKN